MKDTPIPVSIAIRHFTRPTGKDYFSLLVDGVEKLKMNATPRQVGDLAHLLNDLWGRHTVYIDVFYSVEEAPLC